MGKKGEKAWWPAVKRYLEQKQGRAVSVKDIIAETYMIGSFDKSGRAVTASTNKLLCKSPMCPLPMQLARYLTTRKEVKRKKGQWGSTYWIEPET
jgi:hypothetical protein